MPWFSHPKSVGRNDSHSGYYSFQKFCLHNQRQSFPPRSPAPRHPRALPGVTALLGWDLGSTNELVSWFYVLLSNHWENRAVAPDSAAQRIGLRPNLGKLRSPRLPSNHGEKTLPNMAPPCDRAAPFRRADVSARASSALSLDACALRAVFSRPEQQ